MADLKDNLWKALDNLRDADDALSFNQIQEDVDQWKRVRQEMEYEDAVGAAEDEVAIAFYDAVMDAGLPLDKLEQAQKEVINCLRKVVNDIANPAPAGKHAKNVTTDQDKPDGETTMRTYTFDPAAGFTEIVVAKDAKGEVLEAIKDLFDLNK